MTVKACLRSAEGPRRHRGHDVDISWGRVAAAPRRASRRLQRYSKGFGVVGRLNSQSRKRRRSRPCSASTMLELLQTTFDPARRRRVVFAKTRFTGDPNRRLGGALAAQRAVSGHSWLVPPEPIPRPPDPFAPRLGRRSRRSSRRRSRSGPRKFEKLYVARADVLGRQSIGRRVAAAPRPATRIIRGRTAGRAENDTPKTAFKVHVDVRIIKASPTIGVGLIRYIKSLYLDVQKYPRLRGRARLVRRSMDSKLF